MTARLIAVAVVGGLLGSCGGGGGGNAGPPPLSIIADSPPGSTAGMAYPGYTFAATGGNPPLSWSESGPLPRGLALSASGQLSGTPITAGTYSVSVTVADSSVPHLTTSVPVVLKIIAAPNAFTLLGAQLTIPRSGHTATLLASGKVLIAGGGGGAADPSAEVYDPVAGTFTATTGPMTEARINHTATLLGNSSLPNYGKVLILGASDATAELYDPTTDTFKATGSMNHPRSSPTATLLADTGQNAGKVLVVGGNSTPGDLVAELYDPATGAFSDTGSTTVLRTGHTATLLTTGPLAGQVLIAGGNSDTAELYSPVTQTFVQTGGVSAPSIAVSATLLGEQDGSTLNGNVLFVTLYSGSALYDPGTQSFTVAGSWPAPTHFHETAGHTASLRNDGTVLVTGGSWSGCGSGTNSTKAAALFAPETESFTATADLSISRVGHTATTLADGSVLVVGGTDSTSDLAQVPSPHCANYAQVLSAVEVYP